MPEDQTAQTSLGVYVTHGDRNHIVGTWRNVFVCVWRHETHGVAIVNLRPVIEALKARHPAGIAMLTLLEPSAEMPAPEARKELPRLFKDVARGIACSALVFEAEGFRAAAIRALTTTFNIVASQPFPHRVFAAVRDAEAMFIKGLPASVNGERLQRGELVVAAEEFRARLHNWTR